MSQERKMMGDALDVTTAGELSAQASNLRSPRAIGRGTVDAVIFGWLLSP